MNRTTNRWTLMIVSGVALTGAFWAGRSDWIGVAAAQTSPKAAEHRPAIVVDKPPVRVIEDANPSFNAIALDGNGNEVLIGNNNKASTPSILVYPTEFQTTDRVMEPRRRIGGPTARLGDICGLAVSPQSNEIYAVQGEDPEMKVFPLNGNGDLGASRSLTVAHGSADVFLDPKHDELYISTEHINKLTVYRRQAEGNEKPLRFIQGPHTQIADPHGIYVDPDTDELFVTNYGYWRETPVNEDVESRANNREEGDVAPLELTASTGKFMPPSIAIYSRTAQGDSAPLRVIQGAHTGLNLPIGIARDPQSGQIVVANSGGDAVLFFDGGANGDVAPVRILKGPLTNLKATTGVLIDPKRNELWVTSWENHTANVFPASAQGNVAPLRYIRSAPKDSAPASFGTPGAVAWDPKRQEILVPNCVSHPRISVFPGSANGNAVAARTIEGQSTLQARTNHQIGIDSVHDEIVAPNPFAQAILFFRGGAKGEEAPIRMIQGPKTKLVYVDNVAVDAVHGEIVAAQTLTDSVLIFNREPGGDVAPVRILHGPKTKLDQPWKASVDPINNLIAVTTKKSILIFNRTDNGDVAPKWSIEGPNLRAMTPRILTPILYPEGKKIFVTMRVKRPNDPAIAVWKYGDTGDIAPWGVMKSSSATRLTVLTNGGVAIDPKGKDIMALAGEVYGSERILVFHAPELFQ